MLDTHTAGNLSPRTRYNLPRAARHLTSEEDSYGNQKGNQKEIKQQFEKRKLAFQEVAQLQFSQSWFGVEPFITFRQFTQHSEKEHAWLIREKIELKKIQFEEIFRPQILAVGKERRRERNA